MCMQNLHGMEMDSSWNVPVGEKKRLFSERFPFRQVINCDASFSHFQELVK